MDIPLPEMLRQLRGDAFEQKLTPRSWRWGLSAYMRILAHPRLYQFGSRLLMPIMAALGRKTGSFRSLLIPNGWTEVRDFPAPQGQTFMARWKQHKGEQS